MTQTLTPPRFHPWHGITLSTLATAGIVGLLFTGVTVVGFAYQRYMPHAGEIGFLIWFGIAYATLSAPAIWVSLASMGLPLHMALQRLGLTKQWHYAVTGQVAGLLCAGLLYVTAEPGLAGNVTSLAAYTFAGLGGIAAALMWHFSQSKPRRRKGS